MPSLKEYILTLRQHNQGITNRAITLYLLKDGWKIEDIERTFKEIDGIPEVPVVAPTIPVTPVPEIQPTPIIAAEIPAPAPVPTPPPAPVPVPDSHHDLEIQPEELSSKNTETLQSIKSIPVPTDSADKGSIAYPTYAEIQHKIDPLIIPAATEAAAMEAAQKPRQQFSYNQIMEEKPLPISTQPKQVPVAGSEFQGAVSARALQSTEVVQTPTPYIPVGMEGNSQMPPVGQTVQPRHGKKALLWTIITLVVLGGLGFAYMKYVHGIYLFVNQPFTKEEFVKNFATSIAKIDTAEYEATISFSASERPEGAAELDMDYMSRVRAEEAATKATSTATNTSSTLNTTDMPLGSGAAGSSDTLLRMIPQDAKFQATVSGLYNKNQKNQDAQTRFAGSYNGDGISISADVELMKIGEKFFAKINTFPSFFIDLAKIKDKWIVASAEDLGMFGIPIDTLFGGSGVGEKDPVTEDSKKKIIKVFELFLERNVFEVVGEPKKISVGDDKRIAYVYTVSPNLQNFIAFAEQLPVRMKAEFPDAKEFEMSPETLASIKGKAFAYYFDYIKNNTVITLASDAKGVPVYIDIANTIAPKSNELKKQLNTQIHINLTNVNKGTQLVPPTDPMSFVDAYSTITGKSKNDILFDRQRKQVETIRVAIDRYVEFTGTTPGSLDDLKKSTADIAAASSTFEVVSKDDPDYYYAAYRLSTSTRPLYTGSFKDSYSEKDLTYQKTGPLTYQLIYSITLPSIPKSYYELTYTIGKYEESGPGTIARPMILLAYNDGLNTATEKLVSKEADQQKTKDGDKDKVSDAMETYLGTNPGKADTDGDGKNDYDEITNGTNPKGAGIWGVMSTDR